MVDAATVVLSHYQSLLALTILDVEDTSSESEPVDLDVVAREGSRGRGSRGCALRSMRSYHHAVIADVL